MPHRLALLLILALALPACAAEPAAQPGDAGATTAAADTGRDGGPQDDEVVDTAFGGAGTESTGLGSGLTILSTVFPLTSLAMEIAPGADVSPLTGGGQDPHDLELSPADRALVETADVVLYMGDLDFQPQVEAAVADASGEVVSVARVVGPGALREIERGHDEDDGHEEDDHGHDDAVDPHIWFDAASMALVAEAIGRALAAADPANGAGYLENAGAAQAELVQLDAEIDALLAGCSHDRAIVSHEAYAYLLELRDLHQEGVSGAGGHGDASPQRLAELTERIRAEGIPAVLAEPVEGRADAESLASEAGVELLEIDPMEIGTDELLAQGYPAALREQAETFAVALGCG